MDEVIGEWRKLRYEKFHNLYSSPNIIRMVTSVRIRLAEYVARKRDKRSAFCVLLGESERGQQEDLDLVGRIMLKRDFESKMGWHGLDLSG
jgi:hypothetical protein